MFSLQLPSGSRRVGHFQNCSRFTFRSAKSPHNQLVSYSAIMPTSEEYRRFAELCGEVAKIADDKVERMMLQQIAKQWMRLANHKARSQEVQNSD